MTSTHWPRPPGADPLCTRVTASASMWSRWAHTVATYPDSYEERLTEMYPGLSRHIRLLALDPYDLVLTKLTRNADRDVETE